MEVQSPSFVVGVTFTKPGGKRKARVRSKLSYAS
jgi:hypothetical protein